MEALVPIIMFICLASMIFGIYYLRVKESMAMLEKGFNPRNGNSTRVQPFISLKFGLLLAGAGLGLFLAFTLDTFAFAPQVRHSDGTFPLYPSLIGLGGGLGLIISYFIEMKYINKQKDIDKQKEE